MSYYFKLGDVSDSVTRLLTFSVLPIVRVVVMCAIGLALASPCIGILDSQARKLLNQLVSTLFLPCLIFTQLGNAITLEKILEWWFIPVNVVLAMGLGCAVGYVVALIARPPPQFFNFTIMMIGMGNIGNIPLVIIAAICRDPSNLFGDADTCSSLGVAYISFGQWVGASIIYTVGYQLLVPPQDIHDDDFEALAGVKSAIKEDVLDPAHSLSYKIPNQISAGDDDFRDPLLQDNEGVAKMKQWLKRFGEYAKRIEGILKPPVIASFLAILIGATPFLKRLILEEGSPFFSVSDTLTILGGAMIPCVMLALGGNLITGGISSDLGMRTTIAITFTRLLVMPVVGFAVVITADKLGFLPPDDKMLRFVLLLQHSMPTAVLTGAVANLRGHAVKETASVLFYEHIFAIFSMSGWLMLFVNYLF